jgi:hypothetical protein
VNDAADLAPIVDARRAARVGRQMRLNLRKLRARQLEPIPIHSRFLSEAVSHSSPDLDLLSVIFIVGDVRGVREYCL